MKTSVNVIRKLNEFNVYQRTKDGYFDANSLLQQWNVVDGNSKREMKRFLDSPKTTQFIEEIEAESLIAEMRHGNFQAVTIKKGRVTKKGKTKDEVWMHPYLFIDFAMWLNPKFKLQVIKFVYDELIKHRHLSGDWYNKLCSSLTKFPDTDFKEVGRILNLVVFNNHARSLRNSATLQQQEDLQLLERDIYNYIENGFIKTFKEFKDLMRKEWKKRHFKYPPILAEAS